MKRIAPKEFQENKKRIVLTIKNYDFIKDLVKRRTALQAMRTALADAILAAPDLENDYQPIIKNIDVKLEMIPPSLSAPAGGGQQGNIIKHSKGLKHFITMEDVFAELGTYSSHFYNVKKKNSSFFDGKIKEFEGFPGYFIHPKNWKQIKDLFQVG